MITYQVEPFSRVGTEALPLLQRHWAEVELWQDRMPFDPWFDYMFAMERQGKMLLVTCRSNGVLVGYIGGFIGPHIHHKSTLWFRMNVVWLDPAYRQGMIGVKLFLTIEKAIRERGVAVAAFSPKIHFEEDRGGVAKILKFMGYEPTGIEYTRWVQDERRRTTGKFELLGAGGEHLVREQLRSAELPEQRGGGERPLD